MSVRHTLSNRAHSWAMDTKIAGFESHQKGANLVYRGCRACINTNQGEIMPKNHLKPKLFATFVLGEWLIYINVMPQDGVTKSTKHLGLNPYMGAFIIMLLRSPCKDFALGQFLKVLLILLHHLQFCDMSYFGTIAFLLLYLENIISIYTYKLHPCSESS